MLIPSARQSIWNCWMFPRFTDCQRVTPRQAIRSIDPIHSHLRFWLEKRTLGINSKGATSHTLNLQSDATRTTAPSTTDSRHGMGPSETAMDRIKATSRNELAFVRES